MGVVRRGRWSESGNMRGGLYVWRAPVRAAAWPPHSRFPLEVAIKVFVRLAHRLGLRLQLGERLAVDAGHARDVAFPQRVEHFSQRLGLARLEIGTDHLPLQQRLGD